ncbi:MAG: CPBP family intramembrane metalloprotease [Propionibacteriaceae bacterium]|nr:CPBP family intramembrane metalloprotease [Propionibacteriaceae bacterium]
MTEHLINEENAWQRFWNRGGWWKAVGFAAVYLVLYQVLPLAFAPWLGGLIDHENTFATPASVFVAIGLALAIGSVLLVVFSLTVGWLPRPLFGRQPVEGRWWMWFAPVLVLVPILLRVFGTDYSAYSAGVIAVTFLTGALVGFSEELLTRGIAVTLLRRHGYREWAVAVLSSLVFALLHSANLLTGQSLFFVSYLLVYTFTFGLLMYLVMRVTGNIVWAMLLHGLTDPTTMLATGGVDQASTSAQGPLLGLVGPATILMMVGAIILAIFIRGDARGRACASEPAREPAVASPEQPTGE